jgi:hypothetical protein
MNLFEKYMRIHVVQYLVQYINTVPLGSLRTRREMQKTALFLT